jgi:hypothetical protein
VALAAACSSPSQVPAVDAGVDDARVIVSHDAATSSRGAADATPLHTSLRLALLSPLDFGVDVCLRATGVNEPFQGPLLYEQLPSLPDAGLDAPRAADGGPHAGDAGSHPVDAHTHPVDARLEGSPRDGTTRDAHATDGTTPRDATTAADARPDARPDATRDGATDARADSRLDAAADGATDAADGAVADASTDGQVDGALLTDGGERAGGVLAWHVSSYLTVSGAGTFDVVIVPGGSPSCNVHLASQRVTLDAGKFTTLVVVGSPPPTSADGGSDASRPVDASGDGARSPVRQDASRRDGSQPDASAEYLSIVALTDEPALSASLARARFFNATTPGDAGPVGPLRVAAAELGAIVPLANAVAEGCVSSPNPGNPAVDTLGYWEGAPFASTISLRIMAGTGAWTDGGAEGGVDGGADGVDGGAVAPSWTIASTANPFDLIANTNHTGFIVGPTTKAIALVWCNDTATPSVLTSCTKLGAQ